MQISKNTIEVTTDIYSFEDDKEPLYRQIKGTIKGNLFSPKLKPRETMLICQERKYIIKYKLHGNEITQKLTPLEGDQTCVGILSDIP